MVFQPISGKRIILGITGSIAGYKSVDLASKLTQLGAEVDVILTEAATKFINPLTFQSVTGRRAYTDQDLWGNKAHILHVGLTKDADMLCIAPITANTIAKLAHGFCNDLLSVSALAIGTSKDSIPVIIAPAMDGNMFHHEATQYNLNILIKRGYHIDTLLVRN
jgi:phosphopantothenoylcysteine decarboxylase/phosphopantothenate--cysteine ligase